MTGLRKVGLWGKSVAAIAVTVASIVIMQPSQVGAAPPLPHPSLVPEFPARGYPVVLGTPQYVVSNDNCFNCTVSREVYAADQVGSFIVSGGNFFEVELQNGAVLQQKYFAAWNIDTKQIACANQFNFNGIVRSIEPGPTANMVFVGGEFTTVSGADAVVRTRSKIALIDLSSCSVDLSFVALGANGKITEAVLVGSRLFVGGDFTSIGGSNLSYVAELNAVTGAVQPAFNLTFGNTPLSSKIRGMGATPDGAKLIFGGRFGSVSRGGLSLTTQTAVVDISNPANAILTSHRFGQQHPEFGQRPYGQSLQDISISPDGTKIGLAYGTATISDYIYIVNAQPGNQSAVWSHYSGDSNFGIAVSNNAVYISGHFCRIAPGPGPSVMMSPKFGFDTCTNSTGNSNVWRSHMAALSLTDGTPLTWNPGADSFVGGREITVTSRGILIGFDGQRINDMRVGALGFLDFGSGPDTVAPSNVVYTAPAAGAAVSSPVAISGTATDNVAVVKYRVRVLSTNGQWVQANGSLGTTAYEFKPLPLGDGSLLISVHMPVGTYQVETKAVDAGLLSSPDWSKRTFTVASAGRMAQVDRLATTLVVPASPVAAASPIALSGVITSNRGIATVQATVTNGAGLFVQDDLSLGETPHALSVKVGAIQPDASVPWSIDLGTGLPIDTYTVAVDLADLAGNIATQVGEFTVGLVAPVPPAQAVPRAALLAYSGFAVESPAVEQTFGYSFTVSAPISVSALGIFDANQDGVLNNVAAAGIALWTQANQARIALGSVAPGTAAQAGWFYGALSQPVVLQPDVVYVVGYQTFVQGEPIATGGAVADATVVHVLSHASAAGGFVYPSVQMVDSIGFGTPNLQFVAVR